MYYFLLFLLSNVIKQTPIIDCHCDNDHPCMDIYGECFESENYLNDFAISFVNPCPISTIHCPSANTNNIFENKIPIPSTSYEKTDNLYSVNFISDNDINTFYMPQATEETVYLYFNFTRKYQLKKLSIQWLVKSQNYTISISTNCSKSSNFTSTTEYNYKTNNFDFSCDYWNIISNITEKDIFNSYSTTEIDYCMNFNCDNLDNFNFQQLLITLHNINTNPLIIIDITGDSFDMTNQISSLEPNDIPFKFNDDFTFQSNSDITHDSQFGLSKNDCKSIDIYMQHIFNDQIYFGEIDLVGNLSICFTFNKTKSKPHKQLFLIGVHKLEHIEPNYLHHGGHKYTTINSTYQNYEEFIALANHVNCHERYGESIFYFKSGTHYDDTENIGTYYICYSIDRIYWAYSGLTFNIIQPEIYKISGCTDIKNITVDCPTVGNIKLLLYGKNFDLKYQSTLLIEIGPFNAYNTFINNSNLITTYLPKGTGENWTIRILFNHDIEIEGGVSYLGPIIDSISGCEPNNKKTINCNNYENTELVIYGNNFGDYGGKILIGSQKCNNITNINDTAIGCTITGMRGNDLPVFVIQSFGTISDGQDLLSFSKCSKGKELIDDYCYECSPGYFKDTTSDTSCLSCVDGYYTDTYGTEFCLKCIDNSISSTDKKSCLCKSGYYLNNNLCNECDNTNFYGDIIYQCNEDGLTIQTLKNSLGYWRKYDTSLNFYECIIEDLCPSNIIVNGSTVCLEHHTGVLCSQCDENYAPDNEGYCQLCPNSNQSRTVVGLTIMYFFIILIIIYVLLITVLIKGKKILIFFINIGAKIRGTDKLDSDSNKTESSTTEEEEDEIFKISEKIKKDRGIRIQQKVKILITYIQLLTLLTSNLKIKWPDFVYNIINDMDFVNMDIFGLTNEDVHCTMNINYYKKFIFSMCLIPGSLILLYTSQYFAEKIIKRLFNKKEYENEDDKEKKIKMEIKKIRERSFYGTVLFVFLLYPPTTDTILKMYKCSYYEDEWYLTADLSIKCFDSTWDLYAGLSGIFILVYIIGIPLIFHRILTRLNKQTQENKDNKDKPFDMYTDKKTLYRYGFLFEGYKPEYYYFETVEMTKKIILMSTVIYLDESPTRIMIASLIVFIYALLVSYLQPLDNLRDNILNMMAGVELFMLLLFGLILEVKINEQDKYNQFALNSFIFILIFGAIFFGNYELLVSVVKSCYCDAECKNKILGCIRNNHQESTSEINTTESDNVNFIELDDFNNDNKDNKENLKSNFCKIRETII